MLLILKYIIVIKEIYELIINAGNETDRLLNHLIDYSLILYRIQYFVLAELLPIYQTYICLIFYFLNCFLNMSTCFLINLYLFVFIKKIIRSFSAFVICIKYIFSYY